MEAKKTIEIASCPACGNTHIYPFDIKRLPTTIFVRRVTISSPKKPGEESTRFFNCPHTGNVFQAFVAVSQSGETEVRAFPISPGNLALFESAKKQLTDSIDVARKFSQFMITLSITLVPVYFALLKFVGVDEKTVSLHLKLAYTGPALLFLGSCILFIIACFPRSSEYSLEVPEEIESERNFIIRRRRMWIYTAAVVFLVGMLASIIFISLGLYTS